MSVKGVSLKYGITMRNPKQNLRKGSWKKQVVQPNGTGWDRLEYVKQMEQGQGGLHIEWNQMELEEWGLQIR